MGRYFEQKNQSVTNTKDEFCSARKDKEEQMFKNKYRTIIMIIKGTNFDKDTQIKIMNMYLVCVDRIAKELDVEYYDVKDWIRKFENRIDRNKKKH